MFIYSNFHKPCRSKGIKNTFFLMMNADLSSLLSFEISDLSSTFSVYKVICKQRHQFFGYCVSSGMRSMFIKRSCEVKFETIIAE